MTPKQHAEYLVNRYVHHRYEESEEISTGVTGYVPQMRLDKPLAKECALVSIQETLRVLRDATDKETFETWDNYFEQVKNIIKLL